MSNPISSNVKLSDGTTQKGEGKIVNVTQHKATPDQVAVGVVDLNAMTAEAVRVALTFDECPDEEELYYRAALIASEVRDAIFQDHDDPQDGLSTTVMIGGAPYFMGPLVAALKRSGLKPVYAFSKRESVDRRMPDGTIQKVSLFRHEGFVPAYS